MEQRGGHVISGTTLTPQAVAHRRLPRFDVTIMEHYMCDNPSLRDECYTLFMQHPELLSPDVERMTKEQHRELVRNCLKTLLAAGYSPVRSVWELGFDMREGGDWKAMKEE